MEKDLAKYLPNGLQMAYLCPVKEKKVKFHCRKWFLDEHFDRYDIVLELNRPPIDTKTKTINLMGRLKHSDVEGLKQYSECSDAAKEGVILMLDHLKGVWCSGNQQQHDYVVSFLSCTGRRKVKACLYLQSLEQSGKSMVIEFLMKHVFGETVTLMTANMEVVNQYTSQLEGKILVNINEMPCSSKGEWKAMNDKMKTLITDPYFDCRAMYQNPRTSKNTFNMILTSNNNAISLSSTNYRRYKCPDVSNDFIGNRKYFDALAKGCFNDECGEAFFLYLLEHFNKEGKHFNCDKFPISETFTDKICEKLESTYEFIKHKYIKTKTSLNSVPLKELYLEYVEWSDDAVSDKRFSRKLKELRSMAAKRASGGTRKLCFSADHTDLLSEFQSKGWVHELDEIAGAVSDEDSSEAGEEGECDLDSGVAEPKLVSVFKDCGNCAVHFD